MRVDGEEIGTTLQVILWASKSELKTFNRTDFTAVLVTTTDKKGYFFAEYPKGTFKTAFGGVSAGKTAPVPVKLREDGTFPEHVILAFDELDLEEDDSDCSCAPETPRLPDEDDMLNSPGSFSEDIGGGKCVNFTIPNRTLEEYNYYKVVRTTEPQIKGTTIEDDDKEIPSNIWSVLVGLLGKTQSGTGMSVLMPEMHALNTNSRMMMATGTTATSNLSSNLNNFAAQSDLSVKDFKNLAKDPDGFTPRNLMVAERAATFKKAKTLLHLFNKDYGGRDWLTAKNPVDWDEEPTFYQATTIAHGHLLRFKQVWKSDGYSLGDLLYSLPLAPCQKKQIAVFDWDRSESGFRAESAQQAEALNAYLSRDRDINEIITSAFDESVRGGSSATTKASGGGIGAGIGGLIGKFFLGVAGGYAASKGSSSSSAWQNSSRDFSSSSMNQLRDSVMQGASAVRNQRSTVVQQVRQGETLQVQTEVVGNYNHCHAVTMEYFEILRHIAIEQELAEVKECLFVPLNMAAFDEFKAMRWENTLKRYIRDRSLRNGFDALERIHTDYEHSDLPTGTYAEGQIIDMYGDMRISFNLPRPKDDDDGNYLEANWLFYIPFIGPTLAQYNKYLKDRIEAEKDRSFEQNIAPQIAAAMIQKLKFFLVGNNEEEVKLDATLVSSYVTNRQLYVTFRPTGDVPAVAREDVKYFKILSDEPLPPHSKVIVHSASMQYRTDHLNFSLFNSSWIKNDLLPGDPVVISTPLRSRELRNPRKQDKELARKLLAHLNENLEFYHRVIWYLMDSGKRFMLLDGFIAPNSGGKSVASVVENRLIGIVGNCLVMPVAPGYHLDPTYKQKNEDEPIDLLEHYAPAKRPAPYKISIPTRGVYAESVMGACNSCEKKDESRFWRFEESPCPDSPTAIQAISTDSRRSDPGNLQAKDFAAPIVNFQNVPAAPNPSNLGDVTKLLGTPGVFKDITGLDQNQKNALAALEANLEAAQGFSKQAGNLALQASMAKDLDKSLETIEKAKSKGLLNQEQAAKLTESAIRGSIGGGSTTPGANLTDQPEVKKLIDKAAQGGKDVDIKRPGEAVSVKTGEREAKDASVSIDLSGNSSDLRAFKFSSKDKSGEITLTAIVNNAPTGAKYRWTASDATKVAIVSPSATVTKIRALKSGLITMKFEVLADDGTTLKSQDTKLSIPQFLYVTEDAAKFTNALANLKIDYLKSEIVRLMRIEAEALLATLNIRLVWGLAPFNESLPAQFNTGGAAANFYSKVTIKDIHPTTRATFAVTTGSFPAALDFDDIIDLYPDEYRHAGGDVGDSISKYVAKLAGMNFTDFRLTDLWLKVVSRLIGETLAHKVLHSLIDTAANPSGHNNPKITNDLLNKGADRDFLHRTGITVTDDANFPDAGTYTENPGGVISNITATTQARIDARFPAPPTFS
ncbi:MAG: hypothetical protein HRT47_05565 [Candidatus Caenarcaniphilales bacterium]|nr:hypothetical protein [Candidatus Caenarcaniphilales bacterium]